MRTGTVMITGRMTVGRRDDGDKYTNEQRVSKVWMSRIELHRFEACQDKLITAP